MYRQIVRFYVFLLTLLEISLNSKLTAQGKSHGVLHDALISEGITFQEWGKDGGGAGAAAGEGAGAAGGALAVSPPRLSFGAAELGAAHALTVTVTNTANTTLHLASVAGTTPDFHASFFDSKTLPPQGNTTFSVVYVGRREGPVAAHLYIHTSLGVHKYEVSAVGTVSAWGVWPLVGLRVPRDAALTPTLTLTNPTDSTVQVVSVYSSAGWLGLELPDGGAWAPRALWALPPRAARPLVRLRVAPPPPPSTAAHAQPRIAYIRIKTDAAGQAPLVVCVEARAVPPGVHADPVQLRAGLRGSRDPPHTFEVSLGNSAPSAVSLEPGVWGARCSALDAPPAPPPPLPPARANGGSNGGAGGEAARVALLTARLEPNSLLQRAATVTLDWGAMWSGAAGASGSGALCSGYVQLGDAALPYSATLLPGTVHVDPLQFVCGGGGGGCREPRALVVHNQFTVPVHFTHVHFAPDVLQHFHTEPFSAQTVGGGATRTLTSLRLRGAEPEPALHTRIQLHTNVTVYSVPVLVYSGKLLFEWSWPESYSGSLALGAVATGRELRVPLRLRNPAPAPLCVTALGATLPHASLTLAHPHPETLCIEPLGSVGGTLAVRAPAREGPVRGAVHVATQHARSEHAVTLHAVHGDVRARRVALDHCAPWVVCAAPLLVDSSMAATMRLLRARSDQPALLHVGGVNWEVGHGESALGELHYRHELLPRAPLYTGLDLDTAEGEQWVRRSGAPLPALLTADTALLRARLALLTDLPDTLANLSLTLTTTHVVQVEVGVSARLRWPRLARLPAALEALAPVGGAATLTVPVHNPSSRPLLLQPLLGDHHRLPALAGGTESEAGCGTAPCVTSPGAFNVTTWRVASGAAALWARDDVTGTVLVLEPLATVHVLVAFSPLRPAAHTAYLYLRNNLTVVEAVPLAGRGARPSFELAGRGPGSPHPLLLEVSECGAAPARVTLALRNTGPVPVTVTSLLVSGQPCAAHGFSVQPCEPLLLPPGDTRPLHLAFTPDWTLARVRRTLTLLTAAGRADYPLHAAVPARLLPLCGAGAAGSAPGEGALRGAGAVLALLLAALGLALAAIDAEAILKRALAAMQRARPPAAPLDLRALNHAPCVPPPPPPPLPPPPPPRRRRKPRPPLAFDDKKDEWKLSGGEAGAGAGGDDSSRSSAEETEPADVPPGDKRDPTPERDEGTDSSTSEPAEPSQPPPAEGARRAVRRRELATPTRRHEERPRAAERHDEPRPAPRPAPTTLKFHKKDKAVKRRSVPPLAAGPSPPPPPPPPPPSPPQAPVSTVRRGATFSEVVARADSLYCSGGGAAAPVHTPELAARPLAPIGSDLRKRSSPDALAPHRPRAADHSLFYFNGDCAAPPSPRPWDAPPPAPAPPHYAPQDCLANNYTDDQEFSGGLGSSLWSAGDSWTGGWGGYPLRPPPGFPRAPPAPPRAAPPAPVRAFDPFHALAAIWASDRPAWAEPPPPQRDDQRH